ncbi:MAG TPA: alpha/beta hydrolase [Ramlibacter sp.]|nr:alpha/beta hydrolase [Ramlibacter sp.]
MTKSDPVQLEVPGAVISVRLAGDRAKPALLLIHGFPASSASFRKLADALSTDFFVVAPDLPGFGGSEPIEQPSFSRYADVLEAVLALLAVDSYHLYLHDFGAAVALHLATRRPSSVRSLIIQNANAHHAGLGPAWAATQAYWKEPTLERELEATAHLNFDGIRQQYVGGVPPDIASRIDPRRWETDWEIMSLPGRMETQRALVLDYRSHVARFDEIGNYLARWQPPALMLWGRHDAFFAIEETLSWMRALPRMEAHVLDGPHFLLETHPEVCARLMRVFLRKTAAPHVGLQPDG